MKILKYISVNLLVLLALLAALDFCSGLVLDAQDMTNKIIKKKREYSLNNIIADRRDTLANYKNIPWAKTHIRELNSLGTNYKSYYGWRRQEYKGETINIDSLGIRKTIGSLSAQASSVVFLGGSTIWGTGVDDANTIPSLFSTYSKNYFSVLNYGESGYGAYQSLIFLQTQIAKGLIKNIDLIVTYDGVNNSPTLISYFDHLRKEQIEDALNRKKGYRFLQNTRSLISKIKFKYFTPRESVAPSPKPKLSEEDHKQAAIELLESWLMMKKLGEENDARFVCILQPNIYVGEPNIANLEGTQPRVINYKYYSYVTKFIGEVERYKILKSHFIDMTNIFDNLPNIYIDWCHVSPNGNKIVVNHLLKKLN